MTDWKPATIEQVRDTVVHDLRRANAEQVETYNRVVVEPFRAPLLRYGIEESVGVVARKGDEVIYYEDVEEGFNISPISQDGRILEHWCNQDDLGVALNRWIEGRHRYGLVWRARPLK